MPKARFTSHGDAMAREEADAHEAARLLARLESGEEEALPFEIVKRLRTENRIKVLREHRGMTQRELAKAAELNPLYLSQIECGRASGGMKSLTRLAKALGVGVEIIAPPVTPASDRDIGRSAQ